MTRPKRLIEGAIGCAEPPPRDWSDQDTDAVERIAARLRRLARDAKRAGVALVVDPDASGVRVMPAAEMREDDLRGRGEWVEMHGACGGIGI